MADASDSKLWIGHDAIKLMPGALTPGAYVARAYREARNHDGTPPPWAKKLGNGKWVFDTSYIHADASLNLETMGVDEAATLLGASRRAIQVWIDTGIITSAEAREKGAQRLILRDRFLYDLPELKKRLQTPAAIGFKRNAASKRIQMTEETAAIAVAADTKAQAEQPEFEEAEPIVSLRDELKQAKIQKAAAIESALKQARDRNAARAKPDALSFLVQDHGKRADMARAAEDRLTSAAEARRRETESAATAATMAERILADVEMGKMDRLDGLILFNDLARAKDIPDRIRIEVRKDFFGR